MKKRAFITGITGQDGSYLAEFLIKKGYQVHGLRRRSSGDNLNNLRHLNLIFHEKNRDLILHYGDLTDSSSLTRILSKIKPHEVYNLAAQSHVHLSFIMPDYTTSVNALGCVKLLEAIMNVCPKAKFYQASTSELFGDNKTIPQNENTAFKPNSPYSIAKHFAFNIVNSYRGRGLYACNGILFNHESPRRGTNFVTRKIVEAAVKIKFKKLKTLYLGNLYAKRDWGYAKEYVIGMHKILQYKEPSTFVLATNKTHSVREFVNLAYEEVNIQIEWSGKDQNEIGVDKLTGKKLVVINPKFYRPTEVEILLGDASKAHEQLNWYPKMELKELASIMVKKDIERNVKGQSF